ncbi:MAG: GNAT family N-acetyltransferase [Actinomycetota bacterium]|nr:GNAT family N-acetyltransferase [Actinomycetota bacterium]
MAAAWGMAADHNGSMVNPVEQIVIERADAVDAQWILHAYLDDVVSRYHGRPVTEDEMTVALREFPSGDLIEPAGLLLVARVDGQPSGCVGLRLLPDGVGEVTRLFVVNAARGSGLGLRLMQTLELTAADRGLNVLRLDTRSDLVEARGLYARLGYREVGPFNDGPYARVRQLDV